MLRRFVMQQQQDKRMLEKEKACSERREVQGHVTTCTSLSKYLLQIRADFRLKHGDHLSSLHIMGFT